MAELLSENAPQRSPRRHLDVGTGTGLVVQALRPFFNDAIGVDVDDELLAVARAETDQSIANRRETFIQGPAESFSLEPGWLAHLVTVCRAFHWFDRRAFLEHVIQYMEQDGTIAVLGDQSIWAGGDEWKDAARDVIQRVLGPERRAGRGTYKRASGEFVDDLADAGFTAVTSTRVPVRRSKSVESVIGLLHSTSFASPAVLGDRIEEFDTSMRDVLVPLADEDGLLIDNNEFYIYTATRPCH